MMSVLCVKFGVKCGLEFGYRGVVLLGGAIVSKLNRDARLGRQLESTPQGVREAAPVTRSLKSNVYSLENWLGYSPKGIWWMVWGILWDYLDYRGRNEGW